MGDLSLKEKTDILCEQLNIDRGTPLVNVLAQACEQLAVRSDPNTPRPSGKFESTAQLR